MLGILVAVIVALLQASKITSKKKYEGEFKTELLHITPSIEISEISIWY